MSVPPLVPPILIDQMEASRDWSLEKDHDKREIAFRAGWDAAFKMMDMCDIKVLMPGTPENPVVYDNHDLKRYQVSLYFQKTEAHHDVVVQARCVSDALAAAHQRWGGPSGAFIGRIECL